MADQIDLVVRDGLVYDGSGQQPFVADVAIDRGLIVAVGKVSARGREEIDARDRIVTPGFVDVHTHFDGQATWSGQMAPSSGHGVSTAVMGNCGVGFAPCKPHQRDMMVKLMEGVEDIPEIVMTKGLPWNWETFPEYLDAVEARPRDIDLAAHVPHSPLRVFTMGQRGADREPAGESDLARMRSLTAEAVRAGAIGVSTSRCLFHRAKDGTLAPSVESGVDELLALADGLRDAGRGVFQLIPDPEGDPRAEFEIIRQIARRSGRPVSFTLVQMTDLPDDWQVYCEELERAAAEGLSIKAQVFPRPVGSLYGLELSLHPFSFHPGYQPICDLPLPERLAAMRDPELKARILAEAPVQSNPLLMRQVSRVDQMYVLGDPPDYEPTAGALLANQARERGMTAAELAYDLLIEGDGRTVLYVPAANYADNTTRPVRSMMAHDRTIFGLGDGGAHYGIVCDASYPTYILTRWVRDAAPGEAFDLAWAIKGLTRDTAMAVGLEDRGLLKAGYKGDLNVIDFDRLRLHAPIAIRDLPGGGRRLRQLAEGYDVSIVGGEITYRQGEATGALPGRLVRGDLRPGLA